MENQVYDGRFVRPLLADYTVQVRVKGDVAPFLPCAEGNADDSCFVFVGLVITLHTYPCFRVFQCVPERPEIGFAHPDIGETFSNLCNRMAVRILDECNGRPVFVSHTKEIVFYGLLPYLLSGGSSVFHDFNNVQVGMIQQLFENTGGLFVDGEHCFLASIYMSGYGDTAGAEVFYVLKHIKKVRHAGSSVIPVVFKRELAVPQQEVDSVCCEGRRLAFFGVEDYQYVKVISAYLDAGKNSQILAKGFVFQ
ncbi:hypothetical protein ES703_110421 [subsurface metagenome]